MRYLVVTVAGLATRFSESLGRETAKCVYYEGNPEETLLYRMLSMARGFDRVVVVAGFRFDEIESYLIEHTPAFVAGKVDLIRNAHYEDRASGWSLYLGIKAFKDWPDGAVVFVEGDLYLDNASFEALANARGDAVTCCREPVEADKSVALYFDLAGRPRYVYDVGHESLVIDEPFRSVCSSGQAWRFASLQKLLSVACGMGEEAHWDTNLALINRYYSGLEPGTVSMVRFEEWVNCNTADDYRRAFLTKEE